MTDATADLRASELPEAVRRQLVSLVAASLPDVVRLPAAVRRVADFAPARRARLGASAIIQALDAEDDFRDRVGTQVTARVGEIVDDREPAEAAALLWLTRPEDWPEKFEKAIRRMADVPPGTTFGDELARLQERLDRAEQALREQKTTYRAQLEEYKTENTTLRRKLGESRAAERNARAVAEEAIEAAEHARARADAEVAGQLAARDKELRQLKSRLVELEGAVAGERRTAKSERDEATVRARLLLDTLLEAGAGLRRELGLPAVAGAPGERVEAELTQAADEVKPGAGVPTPALLEQLLAMPRSRLIIDGYNVSMAAWGASPLEAQRTRLLNALAPLVARTGAETTVVFDAGSSQSRPIISAPRGVKVVFSPTGVIADDVIRDLVHAEPPGRVVVVASSDRQVATDVAKAGARPVASDLLVSLLQRAT